MFIVTNFPQFKDWFFDKFSEWEKAQPGRRSTYTAFADYLSHNSYGLEIKQQYVSNWSKGTEPSEKYVPVLAELLGKEIYEILGIALPNPYLQKINQLFDRLTPEHQRQLAEDAERYQTKNANAKTTSPKRKPASHQ